MATSLKEAAKNSSERMDRSEGVREASNKSTEKVPGSVTGDMLSSDKEEGGLDQREEGELDQREEGELTDSGDEEPNPTRRKEKSRIFSESFFRRNEWQPNHQFSRGSFQFQPRSGPIKPPIRCHTTPIKEKPKNKNKSENKSPSTRCADPNDSFQKLLTETRVVQRLSTFENEKKKLEEKLQAKPASDGDGKNTDEQSSSNTASEYETRESVSKGSLTEVEKLRLEALEAASKSQRAKLLGKDERKRSQSRRRGSGDVCGNRSNSPNYNYTVSPRKHNFRNDNSANSQDRRRNSINVEQPQKSQSTIERSISQPALTEFRALKPENTHQKTSKPSQTSISKSLTTESTAQSQDANQRKDNCSSNETTQKEENQSQSINDQILPTTIEEPVSQTHVTAGDSSPKEQLTTAIQLYVHTKPTDERSENIGVMSVIINKAKTAGDCADSSSPPDFDANKSAVSTKENVTKIHTIIPTRQIANDSVEKVMSEVITNENPADLAVEKSTSAAEKDTQNSVAAYLQPSSEGVTLDANDSIHGMGAMNVAAVPAISNSELLAPIPMDNTAPRSQSVTGSIERETMDSSSSPSTGVEYREGLDIVPIVDIARIHKPADPPLVLHPGPNEDLDSRPAPEVMTVSSSSDCSDIVEIYSETKPRPVHRVDDKTVQKQAEIQKIQTDLDKKKIKTEAVSQNSSTDKIIQVQITITDESKKTSISPIKHPRPKDPPDPEPTRPLTRAERRSRESPARSQPNKVLTRRSSRDHKILTRAAAKRAVTPKRRLSSGGGGKSPRMKMRSALRGDIIDTSMADILTCSDPKKQYQQFMEYCNTGVTTEPIADPDILRKIALSTIQKKTPLSAPSPTQTTPTPTQTTPTPTQATPTPTQTTPTSQEAPPTAGPSTSKDVNLKAAVSNTERKPTPPPSTAVEDKVKRTVTELTTRLTDAGLAAQSKPTIVDKKISTLTRVLRSSSPHRRNHSPVHITVPTIQPIIVDLGKEDSGDSDDDTSMSTSSSSLNPTNQKSVLDHQLNTYIDKFLHKARHEMDTTGSPKNMTPKVVKNLPTEKQQIYRQLKDKLKSITAVKKQAGVRKQIQGSVKRAVYQTLSSTALPSTSSHSDKSPTSVTVNPPTDLSSSDTQSDSTARDTYAEALDLDGLPAYSRRNQPSILKLQNVDVRQEWSVEPSKRKPDLCKHLTHDYARADPLPSHLKQQRKLEKAANMGLTITLQSDSEKRQAMIKSGGDPNLQSPEEISIMSTLKQLRAETEKQGITNSQPFAVKDEPILPNINMSPVKSGTVKPTLPETVELFGQTCRVMIVDGRVHLDTRQKSEEFMSWFNSYNTTIKKERLDKLKKEKLTADINSLKIQALTNSLTKINNETERLRLQTILDSEIKNVESLKSQLSEFTNKIMTVEHANRRSIVERCIQTDITKTECKSTETAKPPVHKPATGAEFVSIKPAASEEYDPTTTDSRIETFYTPTPKSNSYTYVPETSNSSSNYTPTRKPNSTPYTPTLKSKSSPYTQTTAGKRINTDEPKCDDQAKSLAYETALKLKLRQKTLKRKAEQESSPKQVSPKQSDVKIIQPSSIKNIEDGCRRTSEIPLTQQFAHAFAQPQKAGSLLLTIIKPKTEENDSSPVEKSWVSKTKLLSVDNKPASTEAKNPIQPQMKQGEAQLSAEQSVAKEPNILIGSPTPVSSKALTQSQISAIQLNVEEGKKRLNSMSNQKLPDKSATNESEPKVQSQPVNAGTTIENSGFVSKEPSFVSGSPKSGPNKTLTASQIAAIQQNVAEAKKRMTSLEIGRIPEKTVTHESKPKALTLEAMHSERKGNLDATMHWKASSVNQVQEATITRLETESSSTQNNLGKLPATSQQPPGAKPRDTTAASTTSAQLTNQPSSFVAQLQKRAEGTSKSAVNFEMTNKNNIPSSNKELTPSKTVKGKVVSIQPMLPKSCAVTQTPIYPNPSASKDIVTIFSKRRQMTSQSKASVPHQSTKTAPAPQSKAFSNHANVVEEFVSLERKKPDAHHKLLTLSQSAANAEPSHTNVMSANQMSAKRKLETEHAAFDNDVKKVKIAENVDSGTIKINLNSPAVSRLKSQLAAVSPSLVLIRYYRDLPNWLFIDSNNTKVELHLAQTAHISRSEEELPAEVEPERCLQKYKSVLKYFRCYRLSPHLYFSDQHISPLSTVFSHNLEPNRILCNYDLHGTCQDRHCRLQHAKTYLNVDVNEAMQKLADEAQCGRRVRNKLGGPPGFINMSRMIAKCRPNRQALPGVSQIATRCCNEIRTILKIAAPHAICFPAENKYVEPERVLCQQTSVDEMSLNEQDFLVSNKSSDYNPPNTVFDVESQRITDDVIYLSDSRYYMASDDSSPTGVDKSKSNNMTAFKELEKYVQDNPEDVTSWVKLAFRCLQNTKPLKSAIEKTLHILSLALESNKTSEKLWMFYLKVIRSSNISRKELNRLCEQGLTRVPSYKMFRQYLSSIISVRSKVVAHWLIPKFLNNSITPGDQSFIILQALINGTKLVLESTNIDIDRPFEHPLLRDGDFKTMFTKQHYYYARLVRIYVNHTGRLPENLLHGSTLCRLENVVFYWPSEHSQKHQANMECTALYKELYTCIFGLCDTDMTTRVIRETLATSFVKKGEVYDELLKSKKRLNGEVLDVLLSMTTIKLTLIAPLIRTYANGYMRLFYLLIRFNCIRSTTLGLKHLIPSLDKNEERFQTIDKLFMAVLCPEKLELVFLQRHKIRRDLLSKYSTNITYMWLSYLKFVQYHSQRVNKRSRKQLKKEKMNHGLVQPSEWQCLPAEYMSVQEAFDRMFTSIPSNDVKTLKFCWKVYLEYMIETPKLLNITDEEFSSRYYNRVELCLRQIPVKLSNQLNETYYDFTYHAEIIRSVVKHEDVRCVGFLIKMSDTYPKSYQILTMLLQMADTVSDTDLILRISKQINNHRVYNESLHVFLIQVLLSYQLYTEAAMASTRALHLHPYSLTLWSKRFEMMIALEFPIDTVKKDLEMFKTVDMSLDPVQKDTIDQYLNRLPPPTNP